jgi:hypothetical protein
MHVMDILGPAIGAGVFILGMSRVREPVRLKLNAVLVAGAAGVYMSGGGFGLGEVAFAFGMLALAYFAFDSYRIIGVAWICHAAWDAVHHLYGNPIWPFLRTSSFGCLVFDSLIAVWFLTRAGLSRRTVAACPT